MCQHVYGFRIAKRFSMQPSEIVPESIIFTFNSGHIGLADNLVASRNKTWIDRPAIRDIKETLPGRYHRPQGFKGLGTMVADNPA
jgi:hypothetical protein